MITFYIPKLYSFYLFPSHDRGSIIKVISRIYEKRRGEQIEGVKFRYIKCNHSFNVGAEMKMWVDCRFVKELIPSRVHNSPLYKTLNGEETIND